MCARYSLTASVDEVRRFFDTGPADDFPRRFNIAPSQPVHIVRHDFRRQRELTLVRWGLIPSWVRDPRAFTAQINARSEEAAGKPSFRGVMRHRRCLVPATGYYEWTGARGAKQPHLIRMKDRTLLAFAGLWEHWLGADGSEIETMAVLTTAANSDVAPIHDRMPVIVAECDFARWLDCSSGSAEDVLDLLKPIADGLLTTAAVNPKLNNPSAEGPDLHEPPNATFF